MAVTLFLLLLPIYYMISSSFKTKVQMMDMKQLFVFTPTLNNYRKVFSAHNILTPLLNSLTVSLGATGLACLLGLPAAYAIARHGMHKMSAIILCVRIVPAVTFLIPWYMILGRAGLIGTKAALILANLLVLLPLIIWIVSPYFGSLPRELEDAALVDGCTEAGAGRQRHPDPPRHPQALHRLYGHRYERADGGGGGGDHAGGHYLDTLAEICGQRPDRGRGQGLTERNGAAI